MTLRKLEIVSACLALAFVGIVVSAQVLNAPNFTYQPPNKFTAKWETNPQVLTATLTDPFASNSKAKGTSWGDYASFTNMGTSPCVLEMWDQQDVPVIVVKALIPAYDATSPQANNYIINWGGRILPGGIKWKACDASSISGYMRIMK